MYAPVLPPYPHQVEAAAKMRPLDRFALLMGVRTGKTKVLIDDWGERAEAGETKDLLAVCPGGALYGEDAWETQFPEHIPPELLERTRLALWRSGGGQRQTRELGALLREADPGRPRVLLVNVEALSTVEAARTLCREFLATSRALGRGAEMIVGESTCVRGNSKRTEVVVGLGQMAQVRRIESGLLTPRSPLDLFWPYYFLDPKILGQHSFWGFRARYAILKQVNFRPADPRSRPTTIVVGYRHEDELEQRTEPYRYRRELRDCREAPPPVYRFRDVEMTPEQARVYRELARDATAQLRAGVSVTAEMKMTRITRLHQIACGHLVDDDTGEIHDLPERRTGAVVELLSDYGGKAVVWCAYDHCVRKVVARLQREFGPQSTAAFWGGNINTRVEEERRFKGDEACRYMVATAAAGGRGREWSCADLAVYHSNSPDLEHRHQSESRIEAYGKVDPLTRVDVRVPGTVDDRWIRSLREKMTMASALAGDGYREWLV